MAIEDENGELALKKINELAALQKNSDLAKLAGIKEISDKTLDALNTQLLTELKAINDSKMSEADKEAARAEAFKKYNAAITMAGDLAAKESYSERVQIQLTEIARLASLSKTDAAFQTSTLLRQSAELAMIDRVADAQKKADDARMSALQSYLQALSQVNASAAQASAASALTASQVSGMRYAAQGQAAWDAMLRGVSLTDPIAQGSFTQGTSQGLSVAAAISGANYAAQAAATYNVTVNAGAIGSEELVTQAVQTAIQSLNRGGDPLTTAGTL
jgi:hypothetical protein